MPQGNTWQELLNDNEYKDQLIEMIKQYWSSVPEFYQDIFLLLLLQEKKIIVSPAGNKVITVCNHEEADTCPVLHTSKVDSDVAEDIDVLILMIWAYSRLNIKNDWYMTI